MFPVRDKHGYRQEHLCKYRLGFVLFRFWFRLVYVYLICKVIIGLLRSLYHRSNARLDAVLPLHQQQEQSQQVDRDMVWALFIALQRTSSQP